MAEEGAVRELLDKMEAERGRILAHLDGLSEEAASRSLKPGEWSTKEQLSHMCEMESMYRAWVEKALQDDNANLDGVRGEPVAIPLMKAQQHSLGEHVAELRHQRERTLRLIAAITPEQYEHRASSSLFGTLTILQWLRSYYRHDRMHFDQMRGQEPTYKPRFLSGSEPQPGADQPPAEDQRRGSQA